MTVTADNKRRVIVPSAKPGDLFEVRFCGEGRLTLTRLERVNPRTSAVRFEKRGRFTVGVCDRAVSKEAIQEALADFP